MKRVPCLMSTPSSVMVKSIGSLPIPEEYLGTAELKRLQGQRGAEHARVSCECTMGDAIAALGQYVEYTVSWLLNGDC